MSLLSLFSQASDYRYYSTEYDPQVALQVSAGILFFTLVFVVAFYVLYAIMLGKIFKKAGVESWKAWVPVYNSWVMLELGGQKGYWAVVALIPFVGIIGTIFMYIAMYYIGLSLGKESVFVLLAIFFPIVWVIWLAVDKSTWKPVLPPAGAPVGATNDDGEPPLRPVA